MTGILITGAEGFTAAYVARHLIAQGCVVHGIGRHSVDIPGLASMHPCDIRDADAVQRILSHCRPSHILHLAGIAFVGHASADDFYTVNILGTRNLLEACLHHGDAIDAVVLASSASLYADLGMALIGESAPIRPRTDYAVSKMAMEMVAQTYADRLPITLVRPFNYTGRGQSENFMVPKIVAHFRARAGGIALGNLDIVRDISDVRMVADVYARLLFAPLKTPGQVFNICSGDGVSPRHILALAEELTGYTLPVTVDHRFVRANETAVAIGDRRALEAHIGPLHALPLRETLAWMLE